MALPPTVTFDPANFVATFPVFKQLTQPRLQICFDLAGLYFANAGWTGALPQAPTLLNLLTAHIAWLSSFRDANGNPVEEGAADSLPPPGRVSNASEGSVSLGLDVGDTNAGSPSQAWYMQTTWGQMYWYATGQFRTFRYVPPAPNPVTVGGSFPFFPGRRF